MPTRETTGTEGYERRRHDRVSLPVDAGIYVTSAAGEWIGPVRNLSPGGMFVQCAVPLPVGAEMRLRLNTPARHSYEITCAVRFVVAGGVGMEFLQVPRQLSEAIQSLCAVYA